MTEQSTTPHRSGKAMGEGWTRAGAWVTSAVRSSGTERDNVVIVLKSALAAWLAWLVSHDLMGSKTPAFAPFSAVLMMQITVYQSVVQSLRYVAAVGAGVALQALFGFFIGPDLLTFAVVALVALAIGRWPALGSQGTQVATAAFFAFSTYLAATTVGDRVMQLGQLVVLVLVGSGIGVVVNLLVLPPMRYRSAEYGVRRVADDLAAILEDVGPALREEELDTDRSSHWRTQAAGVGRTVAQARTGLHTARESRYYNPRRLLPRNRQSHGFRGYETVLDALERVSHQLASLVRALDRTAEAESGPRHRDFLNRYADCTDALAAPARLLAGVDETRLPAQIQELRDGLRDADVCADRLDETAGQLDISLARGGGPPYGVLLIEAHRLLEEFHHTTEVLADSLPVAARPEQ